MFRGALWLTPLSLPELETKIQSMIEERLAGIDVPAVPTTSTCLTSSADAVSKEIKEMIGDLDLFGI